MGKANGVVEKVFSKKGSAKGGRSFTRYSICIDGEWYNNGFKAPDCAEGDEVTLTYEENDYGKEIKKLVVDSQGRAKSTSSPVKENKEVQIVRQNALRHASTLVAAGKTSPDDLLKVLDIAEFMFAYVFNGPMTNSTKAEKPAKPTKKAPVEVTDDDEDNVEDIN